MLPAPRIVPHPRTGSAAQSGIVLVSSLLLLLVVTIMALSIFRSFGVQEKIAGNIRDKQRALQGAMSTQQYAENWLATSSGAGAAVNGGNAQAADVTCTAAVTTAQICDKSLKQRNLLATSLPWSVGVLYAPTNMSYGGANPLTAAAVVPAINDVYYDEPRFYIADLGTSAAGNGEVYQVDAYSYGTSGQTVAVVESTVAITCIVSNPGALGGC